MNTANGLLLSTVTMSMLIFNSGCVVESDDLDTGNDNDQETDADAGDTEDDDTESASDTPIEGILEEIQGQWKLVEYAWEYYLFSNEDITDSDGGGSDEERSEYITFSDATMVWIWSDTENDCQDTWEVADIEIADDGLATDPGDHVTGISQEDEMWEEWATEIAIIDDALVVTLTEAAGTDADYEMWVEIYTFVPSDEDIPPSDWPDAACEIN